MKARSTMFLTTAVAVGVALLAGGCGGGGGSSLSSSTSTSSGASTATSTAASSAPLPPVKTSSLSKAAFVKKASAACRQKEKGLSGREEKYIEFHAVDGQPQGELLASMVKTVVVPMVEAETAAIQKLGAPAGDEKKIEAILAAKQAGIDAANAEKSLSSSAQLEADFAAAEKQLRAYGFSACIAVIP